MGWDETDHRISIEWERLSYGAKETIRIRSCNIIATVLLGFLVFSQRFSLETRHSFDFFGGRKCWVHRVVGHTCKEIKLQTMAWSPRGQSFRPIFEGSECWSSGVDFVSSFGCLLGMPIQHLTPFVLPWRMLNIASDHCWSLLPFGCLSFMWTGNEHMSLEISLAMFGRIFIAALAYIYKFLLVPASPNHPGAACLRLRSHHWHFPCIDGGNSDASPYKKVTPELRQKAFCFRKAGHHWGLPWPMQPRSWKLWRTVVADNVKQSPVPFGRNGLGMQLRYTSG